MSTIKEQLESMVESIVKNLEQVFNGELAICEECGEVHPNDDDTCPVCGEETRQMSFMDYFEDALDFEAITGFDRKYRHASILVAYGGPNIRINTKFGTVEGHWGTTSFEMAIPEAIVNAIDTELEEYWNCF